MIDLGGPGNESSPKRDLPAWTVNEALIKSNPELHHYTTRCGLEGIWETNSLRATHFSNLLDSLEIVLLKKPLQAALATRFGPLIIKRQQESPDVRRHVAKKGGPEVVAREHAHSFVEAGFKLAFTGGEVSPSAFARGNVRPFADPFICSFCSHANDHSYEQENGLLSQWRGYGGNGRYALVFDTRRLDDLLAVEWRAHFWTKLDIKKVVYFEGSETLEKGFPDLLETATELISRMLYKKSYSDIDYFAPFSQAATLLKHRGFREEREVRIVACPQSVRALADRGMRNDLLSWPPTKKVRGPTNSKKHVVLFESLNATLPIKRIIVGPGANQKEDEEFARSVVSDQVPIVVSETPFIG